MKVVKIIVPPDKSISQRAIMLASISEGTTRIKNLLMGDDVLRAIEAFRAMGVEIALASTSSRPRNDKRSVIASTFASLSVNSAKQSQDIVVHGAGMRGLKKPSAPLYLGNSGTTMRILPGILAGQDFEVTLKGDASLSSRPMGRIAKPLSAMGAKVSGKKIVLDSPKYSSSKVEKNILARSNNIEIYPPLKIKGGKLKAIKYVSKIASAQVKSCVLLAGLFADGMTSVTEPVKSRDHTERMLRLFGVKLFSTRSARSKNIVRARPKAESRTINLKGPAKLKSPGTIEIPGDISSAAFFIVAGCILPGRKVVLKNIGVNPTRTGVIDILKRMGADIKVHSSQLTVDSFEPAGDIVVKSGNLRGVTISAKEVVRAIDEMPVIMVAACLAEGRTVIKGIGELRVKETDRVKSMVTNLRKMGADILVHGSQLTVHGQKPLYGATVSSFGDHRTAMSMLVAGLAIKGVKVKRLSCIKKSFPGFKEALRKLN